MHTFEEFFKAAFKRNFPKNIGKLVIVTHIIPNIVPFLQVINTFIPVAAIIPKPHSIDKEVYETIRQIMPILPYTRYDMKERTEEFLSILRQRIGESNFAILDMGGYFAPILDALYEIFGTQIIGIVEDTENGLQKYQSACRKRKQEILPYPAISVARSSLKDPEDFLVGQAVVFSAEALFRKLGKIPGGHRALVFGYGKIGSSIAHHLSAKMMRVDVYDTDPIRQILALSHGFFTNEREKLLHSADIIFCATGNFSLEKRDFLLMKDRAYIFMATSIDDEIKNYESVLAEAKTDRKNRIAHIEIAKRHIFLCNEGQAANFMYHAGVGNYIALIQAELFAALSYLPEISKKNVQILPDTQKEFIADLWLKMFCRTS